MEEHRVRVYPSAATPPREQLLAWKLAAVAADDAPLDDEVVDMIVNRVLDNAGVAIAGIVRRPVANARAQACAHPQPRGATVFGLPRTTRLSCEWQPGDAGPLECANHALDVERIAIACICVGDQRQTDDVPNLRHAIGHFRHREKT
jgi:hypothetical protein